MCSDCDYGWIDEDYESDVRHKVLKEVKSYLKSIDVEGGWIMDGVLGVIQFGYNKYPDEELALREKISKEIKRACDCYNCEAVSNFIIGNEDFAYSRSV
jgi:hypothetical protein